MLVEYTAEKGVAVLTLNDPPVNAYSHEMMKELDERSQDNRYVLNDIARLYEQGDAANLAKVNQEPANIAALSAEVIHQSAMKYFDTANYVQVTLMPQTK